MILLRFAQASDEAAIKAIENSLPKVAAYSPDILDKITQLDFKHIVVEVDNEVVGHCIYSSEPGTQDIQIIRIAVHSTKHRKGYGYAMVNSLIVKARHTHVSCRVSAVINETRPWERLFFSACGLILVEKCQGEDEYLMEISHPTVEIQKIKKRPRFLVKPDKQS